MDVDHIYGSERRAEFLGLLGLPQRGDDLLHREPLRRRRPLHSDPHIGWQPHLIRTE
jgi:hypothetical protein